MRGSSRSRRHLAESWWCSFRRQWHWGGQRAHAQLSKDRGGSLARDPASRVDKRNPRGPAVRLGHEGGEELAGSRLAPPGPPRVHHLVIADEGHIACLRMGWEGLWRGGCEGGVARGDDGAHDKARTCHSTSRASSSQMALASRSTSRLTRVPSPKRTHSSTPSWEGTSLSGSNPPPALPTWLNSRALAIVAMSWLKKHLRSVPGAVLTASRRGVTQRRKSGPSLAPRGPTPHSHSQPPRAMRASHSSRVSTWKKDFQDRPAPLVGSCSGPAKMV
mmetsp:Transcript_18739/g.62846  ORF Transcript_18739/g.62846 Transcript_18739/m.62846 type:complete len:275 (+) Transcript_18739:336-1160(+)